MSQDPVNQQLQALQEREREILKKISVASRAGVSEQVMGQLNFMLDECRFQQLDIKQRASANNNKDSDFDNFLSIG